MQIGIKRQVDRRVLRGRDGADWTNALILKRKWFEMKDGLAGSAPSTDVSSPRMPLNSQYAGEEVDLSWKRSIQLPLLAKKEQTLGQEATHAVVDHFFHEGANWRALIPLNGVSHVCGQAINFSRPKTKRGVDGPEIVRDEFGVPRRTWPMLNHLQTRVAMLPDSPIELYALDTDEFGTPEHRVDEFVYSVEAIGPPGVDFNFCDALHGNLLSVHRSLSLQEMAFERLVVLNQWILESPALPLTREQLRAVLIASVQRGHRAGLEEMYYLIRLFRTSNCTSHPFQILDSVMSYKWHQRLGAMLYRLPLSPRFYLRVRGLDADPARRNIFRDEFADYVKDKATQRRKREFVRRQIELRRARKVALSTAPS